MNAADSELVRPLRANAYHQTGVPSTSAFTPLRPTCRPSTRKSVLAIVLSDLRAEVHLASACQSLTSQRRKAEPSPPRVKCAKCHGTRLDCPTAHGRCSFSPNLCLEAFVFPVSCVFFVRVGCVVSILHLRMSITENSGGSPAGTLHAGHAVRCRSLLK